MKIESAGLFSMPAEQYHSHPAVGHSGLVRIMRSPAHYKDVLTDPPDPTPAMRLGTAFHTALLEPDRFGQTFVVAPKFDRRTKEGKAQAEAWDTENAGKTALTPEDASKIDGMVTSVRGHIGAARLLSNGQAEMSGFWSDPETGAACKCRPDFISGSIDDPVGIIDVKTACDASADGFSRAIASLSYDLQAAYYVDGMKELTGRKLPFFFVVIEKDAPHAVAVYRASEALLETGRSKYRAALELLRWCQEKNSWPGYQPGGEIEEIDLPRWAANFSM